MRKVFIPQSWIDVIISVGITVFVLWYYGLPHLSTLAYSASDTPVHMYWVNAMNDNNIFVAGVYPFGFHCIIYYLHKVFNIKTYVIFCQFGIVQTLFIIYALLAFLKLCCKTKYLPYAGVIIYIAWSGYRGGTYSRYFATLPQEYSMLFILPAIYCGFAFFKTKHMELKEGLSSKASRFYLEGFAVSFSMTLAVHFYGTIIAGLFCAAMALGYAFLFFRPKYFGRVLLTVLISLAIAIAPMAVAYATGTPLQGSLNWGMNVMSGKNNTSASLDNETTDVQVTESDEDTTNNSVTVENPDVVVSSNSNNISSKSFKERFSNIGEKLINAVNAIIYNVGYYNSILYSDIFGYVFVIGIVVLIILGIVFFILRKSCYGAMLISIGLFMLFMGMLQSASTLHLIPLMDADRTSIFFSYVHPIELVLIADGIICLLLHFVKRTFVRNAASLACVGATVAALIYSGQIKDYVEMGTVVTNEAFTCTSNILHLEDDFKWTIVSANDEYRMTEEYGRHFELLEFLRNMEGYTSDSKITIPTDAVYFYIEKKPLDYYEHYINSGQFISQEGAMKELPASSGIYAYAGENRWILMSRMYAWAQSFMKMYPNEMTVYMETDDFVCYRLQQNTYHLYNFAIDYGYNVR